MFGNVRLQPIARNLGGKPGDAGPGRPLPQAQELRAARWRGHKPYAQARRQCLGQAGDVISALRRKAVECRRLHPVVQQAENIILDNGKIVAPRNLDNRIPALARHGECCGILQRGNQIEYF
jgi:hypothetical protein